MSTHTERKTKYWKWIHKMVFVTVSARCTVHLWRMKSNVTTTIENYICQHPNMAVKQCSFFSSYVLTIDSLSTADATINEWIHSRFFPLKISRRKKKLYGKKWEIKKQCWPYDTVQRIQMKNINELRINKKKMRTFSCCQQLTWNVEISGEIVPISVGTKNLDRC